MWGPTQILGLIGSAVLAFIGYKRTDKQRISILGCQDTSRLSYILIDNIFSLY